MPQYDAETVEEIGKRAWQPFESCFREALCASQADIAWNTLNRGLEAFLDDVAGTLPQTWPHCGI